MTGDHDSPRPIALGGDKGYSVDWIDEFLLTLGASPVIPSNDNEDQDANLVNFDRDEYKRRFHRTSHRPAQGTPTGLLTL